ncbi:DUF4097 family beta strand repeat-containing protein [Thalassotalea sediminis]|uniref:DUF4097 family beta strand repeat-containing protein n=1 Tax=Thalassotalea sediminis TaxID=1759089 RepID=UPI0025744DA3|nr:DUF4097 family beta strand repeat-containing protein [Thalassotalea sediminis]
MKKLLLIAGALTALSSWSVLANERVDETVQAEGVGKISIDNLRGKVLIEGWDKTEVSVKGELDEQTQRFIFERNGNAVKIKVKVKNSYRGGDNSDGSDLVVMVPRDVRVDFAGVSSDFTLKRIEKGVEGKTVSGDLHVSNIGGQTEIATVSGDIVSRQLSGKILLNTVSGDIEDTESKGRLKIRAVSGNVKTLSKAREVDLSVVSGEIEFMLGSIDDLELSAVSGEIAGELTLADSARVKMSSVSGDIGLKFNEDVNATFRLKTHAGGDLINKITDDRAQESKYSPRAKLYFDTGNGSASVKGTTVSGTIRLTK